MYIQIGANGVNFWEEERKFWGNGGTLTTKMFLTFFLKKKVKILKKVLKKKRFFFNLVKVKKKKKNWGPYGYPDPTLTYGTGITTESENLIHSILIMDMHSQLFLFSQNINKLLLFFL